jgi:hypothetical protein
MTKSQENLLEKGKEDQNRRITKPAKPTIRHDDTLATPTDLRTESKDFKISQRGVWESGKITLTWWVQNRDSIANAASWRSSSRKQKKKTNVAAGTADASASATGREREQEREKETKEQTAYRFTRHPSALIPGAYSRSQNPKTPSKSQNDVPNWIKLDKLSMCVLMDEWMNFISSHG